MTLLPNFFIKSLVTVAANDFEDFFNKSLTQQWFEKDIFLGNLPQLNPVSIEDIMTYSTSISNLEADRKPRDIFVNSLEYKPFDADLKEVTEPIVSFSKIEQYHQVSDNINSSAISLNRFLPQFKNILVGGFTDLVVFGDSLSDTGNLFNLTNGQIPSPLLYFEQRFSNGPLWIDYLSSALGFNPNEVNNFAIGGATTGRFNITSSTLPIQNGGLLDQIDNFISGVSANGADPNALYFVWAGANDILTVLSQGIAPQNVNVVTMVDNLETAINTLADLGATEIVVPNIVDLGLIPFTTGFAEIATQLTIAFNSELDTAISNLEANRPGLDIIPIDTFGLSQAVAANPNKFGFTNISDPLLNLILAGTPPSNPQDYVFWDEVHPTTQFHSLLAGQFYTKLLQSEIFPDFNSSIANNTIGIYDTIQASLTF